MSACTTTRPADRSSLTDTSWACDRAEAAVTDQVLPPRALSSIKTARDRLAASEKQIAAKEAQIAAKEAAAAAAYRSSCERSVERLGQSEKVRFLSLVSAMARDLRRISDVYSADERCDILSGRLSESGDPSDVVRVDCAWSEICYEYILGD